VVVMMRYQQITLLTLAALSFSATASGSYVKDGIWYQTGAASAASPLRWRHPSDTRCRL